MQGMTPPAYLCRSTDGTENPPQDGIDGPCFSSVAGISYFAMRVIKSYRLSSHGIICIAGITNHTIDDTKQADSLFTSSTTTAPFLLRFSSFASLVVQVSDYTSPTQRRSRRASAGSHGAGTEFVDTDHSCLLTLAIA